MSAVVVFEWTFFPPDFFEEPIEIVRDDYTLTIANGKAEARMDSTTYEANPSIRQTLHEGLNDRFLGFQLVNHRAYKLSRSAMTRMHPDGRRDLCLAAEVAAVSSTGRPALIILGKNGSVICDPKRDRFEKAERLGDLVSTYHSCDETVASLVRSHKASVDDPNNELVHLYEIRDALVTRFRTGKSACSALGTSSNDWDRLGQLCNREPLRQGRHRGKTGSALRDATQSELVEARRIASGMIEAFLLYLDTMARRDRR
jgi:hypothetical protein